MMRKFIKNKLQWSNHFRHTNIHLAVSFNTNEDDEQSTILVVLLAKNQLLANLKNAA